MKVIGTPLEAHELHTAYYQWRLAHPKQDRLLHHGHWLANQDADPLSIHDLTALGSSEAYHNVSRVLDDVVISRADTVFLSDEVRGLVVTAEATMPDEVLFTTDLFTPCGFVVMETGIERRIGARVMYDEIDDLVAKCLTYGASVTGERKYSGTKGEPIDCMEVWSVQAFSWGDGLSVASEAVSEICSQYGADSEAYKIASSINKDTATFPLHVRVYGSLLCSEIDGLTIAIPAFGNAPLHLIDRYGFIYGEDGATKELETVSLDGDESEMDINALARQKETRRFIVALLRLMEEYIEVDKSKMPRSFARRADRAGRGGDTANVSLLALRRSLYGEAEEGTGRKVTLAHLVRGHWRNQWYPSQNAHRYKWINAHRRGGHKDDEVTERPRVITVTK